MTNEQQQRLQELVDGDSRLKWNDDNLIFITSNGYFKLEMDPTCWSVDLEHIAPLTPNLWDYIEFGQIAAKIKQIIEP